MLCAVQFQLQQTDDGNSFTPFKYFRADQLRFPIFVTKLRLCERNAPTEAMTTNQTPWHGEDGPALLRHLLSLCVYSHDLSFAS
jgi:hypothetical protein